MTFHHVQHVRMRPNKKKAKKPILNQVDTDGMLLATAVFP